MTDHRPLPNDDEGAWVLLRDDAPSAWQHVGGILLLVAGIALSWIAWEAGWRIGLRLAGVR